MGIDSTDRADSGRYVSLDGSSWTFLDSSTTLPLTLDGGFTGAGYVRVRGGMLCFSGQINYSSGIGNNWGFAYLPTGLKPAETRYTQCRGTSNARAAINIGADGHLIMESASGTVTNLLLDGMNVPA